MRNWLQMFFAVFFAILAAVAVIFLAKYMDDVQQQAALAKIRRLPDDVQAIETQLHLYEAVNGFYPTTKQGLKALVTQPHDDPRPARWYQLFKKLPKDSWGSNYIYESPGWGHPRSYDLISNGPDRRAGTRDDYFGGG